MTANEGVDGTDEAPNVGAGAKNSYPPDIELETIEALRSLEEQERLMELEAATSPEPGEAETPPSLDKESQGDRIEHLSKKALRGITEIADHLNPVHKASGNAVRPEPLRILVKSANLMVREIWTQRCRLAAIEKTMAQQAADLKTLKNDLSFLINMLHSDEAET